MESTAGKRVRDFQITIAGVGIKRGHRVCDRSRRKLIPLRIEANLEPNRAIDRLACEGGKLPAILDRGKSSIDFSQTYVGLRRSFDHAMYRAYQFLKKCYTSPCFFRQ